MPPSKASRVQQEDSTFLKEKHHSHHTNVARGRRNGNTTGTNGSNLKEVMTSNADTPSTTTGQSDQGTHSGISWSTQDREVLQGYRRAYRLDTPSTFKNPLSNVILGNGIGRYSPTMARPKSKRRITKDQLGLAVRKNFNALGVNEGDVIVDLLYKVKNQDKEFRVRFAPQRK
ncbi:hypothetical protein GQ43DRAFT_201602 [Delitschia confertaspora ATCC 74209]|uniref:Histone deacetylase complex subunit SAP30 Sin3 binding domain-containing protein n=1 Tax=Delitschia confertaspora ATCC 74209 TaxID=1513339 RepID=A0A9P4MS04_9PLEO|nr:hypothetical protein GQ43DRAFT_201602 [Delitschia confertaspora ATCC 74209]